MFSNKNQQQYHHWPIAARSFVRFFFLRIIHSIKSKHDDNRVIREKRTRIHTGKRSVLHGPIQSIIISSNRHIISGIRAVDFWVSNVIIFFFVIFFLFCFCEVSQLNWKKFFYAVYFCKIIAFFLRILHAVSNPLSWPSQRMIGMGFYTSTLINNSKNRSTTQN